jgi:hypothetical protein
MTPARPLPDLVGTAQTHLNHLHGLFEELHDRLIVAPPDESLLLAEFFHSFLPAPASDESLVADRLKAQSLPKLALGRVCHDRLAAWYQQVGQPLGSEAKVFFESGSTPGLAALALSKLWGRQQRPYELRAFTNNLLVQLALHHHCPTRMVYGDCALHLKYFGYFPLSAREFEEEFRRARRPDSDPQLPTVFADLVTRAWQFDLLFMTCSEFHFAHGPFVGSPLNALFKAAFFTSGLRLHVLLDGSKVLFTDPPQVHDRCIQVFDAAGAGPFSDRNPCVQLDLVGGPLRAEMAAQQRVPPSWAEAARAVCDRGELWVHVAAPDFQASPRLPLRFGGNAANYFDRLDDAVRRAQAWLSARHPGVRLVPAGDTDVQLDAAERELAAAGRQPQTPVVVRVRHFRYENAAPR